MNNYQALIIIADGIVDHAERYTQLANELTLDESDPERSEELREIARICGKVPLNPAESFWEAIQFSFLTSSVIFGTTSNKSPAIP